MKSPQYCFMVLIGVAVFCAMRVSMGAGSRLQTEGTGKHKVLVEAQFPADRKAQYGLFKEKCTQCHEMARPIAALETGITPVSHDSFDDAGIKKYVVKMMRKPNSGITKEDAKTLIDFLQYARELAKGGV